MFLSTKSLGVRRLSLVLALLAACYGAVAFHRIEYYHDATDQYRVMWINLASMAVLWLVCFAGAWVAVRTLAWVIAGFMADRSTKP